MSDVRYTKEHEWVRLDGDLATVGISDYAQQQLGDVFVELPEIGRQVSAAAAWPWSRASRRRAMSMRAAQRRGGRDQRRSRERPRPGQPKP